MPVVSAAQVNGHALFLTATGLMVYDTQWQLLASLPEGRALLALDTHRAVIATSTGMWLWDGVLHRVHNETSDLSGGCCLEQPSGNTGTFMMAGERGVQRITLD
jgi:hypothetical protein